MDRRIIYCQMTQDRLHETKECVERALPYVDHIVLVDGGSRDDSIYYFRNWSEVEPKIHFYLHPWEDNFSRQRNNYLFRAGEVAKDGDWILVSDPDEWFEEKTFQNLHNIASFVESVGHTAAGFQCRSISLKGPTKVHESMDDYWKHLFYRWEPDMHYVGNPHEGMVMPRHGFRMVNTPFIYEHIKQENIIWKRGCRNMYIGGGGPNLGDRNQLWLELRSIVKDVYGRLLVWHEFEKEMLKGNLDQRVKGWMTKVRLEDGWDGASEHRESYKYYFRVLHPEEEPEELRGEHIP